MTGLLLIPIFLGLMYVLVILPQQRRVKAHQELVRALEPGVEVMMTSGVYGRLVSVDDETAELEIAPGVVVKIARASVGMVVRPPVVDVDSSDEGPDGVGDDETHEASNGADRAGD